MVKNTRKKKSFNPILPLNQPIPINVYESETLSPISITLNQHTLNVSSLEETWEIIDEWWKPNPIERRYHMVILENGSRITIFVDLITGLWFRQIA
jgi:hypothetical protein